MSPAARLVYRGALSLPDSNAMLDGLAFSALVTAEATLLQNPLALALESLRGIPLRFLSLVSLADIYFDSKATPKIVLDIHPHAGLSQAYFTSVFCVREQGLAKGVRVALGDTDASNIVIYASDDADDVIQLRAARITPPPSTLPRPDDPTPRKPPPVLMLKGKDLFPPRPVSVSKSSSSSSLSSTLKRSHSEFKVPDSPASMEKRNKELIRTIVAKSLPSNVLPKNHEEYKETFTMIHRGVRYALRKQMQVREVSQEDVKRLARVHISMYVGEGTVKSQGEKRSNSHYDDASEHETQGHETQ